MHSSATWDVDRYLQRLGLTERPAVDTATLFDLQLRHLRTVPFENLSIHLGEPLSLAPAALRHKIVDRNRGGFCYELNGAFAGLLAELGYSVTLLAACVFNAGVPGPPLDHLALRVDLEHPWLVDVGFGRFAYRPLRLDLSGEQPDPEGTLSIRPAPDGDLDVFRDGRPQYRLEPKPRRLADFEAMCWYQAHSPDSHFTQSLTCSIVAGDGRATLTGDRLIFTGLDGSRREQALSGEAEVLTAYRDHFGISLSHVPAAPQRDA